MFDHFSYIPADHQTALATSVRAHNQDVGTNPQAVARLYRTALDGLAGPVSANKVHASTMRCDGGVTVSTATDADTGIFVQLAVTRPGQPPLLTFGRKLSMEGQNSVNNTRDTVFWGR